jgi:hypothetical protein
MRVGPYPLHSVHDRLLKRFLKTKESGIENPTKIWQDFLRYAVHVINPLRTIAALLLTNYPEMECETHYSSHLIRYQTAIEGVVRAKRSCRFAA